MLYNYFIYWELSYNSFRDDMRCIEKLVAMNWEFIPMPSMP